MSIGKQLSTADICFALVFLATGRRYLLLGGGYTNDCISNCCQYPYNTGDPYGWGCACPNPPANC